jgi:hypothetical protein
MYNVTAKGSQMNLWKYNPITGIWKLVRDVTEETAQQWLTIFQADEPTAKFVVSNRKPRA